MNANQIVNMVIRMVLRKAVRAGVKAGAEQIRKSRRGQDGHVPEG